MSTITMEARRSINMGSYAPTEYPELDCVIGRKDLSAMAFEGKAARPAWHYRFKSPERMDQYITKYLENRKNSLASRAAYKAERKAARKAPALAALPYAVGDVLYYSWGYEQTNVTWLQVVGVPSKSTVILREIHAHVTETGMMSGHSEPCRDSFRDEPFTKRVQWDNGKPYINAYNHHCAYKWSDGDKPPHCSWYA